MDTLDLRNLQLSYQAIYDDVLCESMEELGLIGEARDGYGDDSKFNKPDDKIEKPGTTVPKPKKGGYGRISRSTPYGIGAHANRTQSAVTRTVGEDPGAPRSVKMAKDGPKKKGSKMVKKDGKWVKEALEYYELILSHLLDEGYAEDVDSAEAIMVNMSEEWVGAIMEEKKNLPIGKMKKKEYELLDSPKATKKYHDAMRTSMGSPERKSLIRDMERWRNIEGTRRSISTRGGKRQLPMPEVGRYTEKYDEGYDYYDVILDYLINEGYAETVENAEAIMVNMSEEWVGDIVEGYKKLPIGKMIKQAARKAEGGFSFGNYNSADATQKEINKMARVADRHSLIKGKGRVRGEGQAELNRRRGES